MLRVALKGLATRRLRAVLTALAIVLGVALVAGTYVLTDSITGAFASIFQTIYRGTDATITGRNAIDSKASGGAGGTAASTPSFSQSLLARVGAARRPRRASAVSPAASQLIKNGKAISFGGAPNLGFSVDPVQAAVQLAEAGQRQLAGAIEVVVDTNTASKKNLHAGEVIGVQANGPGRPDADLGPGRVRHAPARSAAPRWPASSSPPRSACSARWASSTRSGSAPSPGSAPSSWWPRSGRSCRATPRCGPARSRRSKDASSTTSFLSFLKTFLLVFAGVALFVGQLRDRQLAVDHHRPAHP